MKLIYIANARIPTEKAHGIQIMEMCRAFSDYGEVELWLPRRINLIRKNPFDFYGLEKKFKIKKIPCLDIIFLGGGKITFFVQTTTFFLFCKLFLLFRKYDFIYTREPLAGKFFKNLFLEIHSLPEKIAPFYKKILREARAIVVLTGLTKEIIRNLGVEEKKIFVAPDGVNIKKFSLNITREEARKRVNLETDKKIILYSGSFYLYDWKGVDVLLKLSEIMPENFLVVLVGGYGSDIEKIKKTYGSKNLVLRGQRPYGEIPYFLKSADILVLPNKKGDRASEKYTSPLKLFEYMASGTPIVASNLPSLREILNENNSVLVEPDNPESLAEGIKKLMEDKELAQRISSRALSDAQNFTWQKRAEAILNFINLSKNKTHPQYLLENVPNLLNLSILDLGSGRGKFLIDITKMGGKVVGIEINDAYIKETLARAKENGVEVGIVKGAAENLPFKDGVFDFVNFSLVVEHVEDSYLAIKEMARVLKKNGLAYMGVPNRFGFKDPHYHLCFVNWLPRAWCDRFISLFGKYREYSGAAGRQSLVAMHYFTFGQIKKVLNKEGFEVIDIRKKKLKKNLKNNLIYFLALFPYWIYRFFFSDSFHLLLKRI